MNFLIVGLGSMGCRRIRCLQALGYKNIVGFDLRSDRCQSATEKNKEETFSDYQKAFSVAAPNALIISVPPDKHHIYMKHAVENKISFFVEASVVDTDMEAITKSAKEAGITAAPSLTMNFHPAIQGIQEIIRSGRLGKISNITYHSGQYLPDWHTYEAVSDYYVSNPLTGGAREIVPFELCWITHVFGYPKKVGGNFRKTIDIAGAEKIDDTYNFLMDYGTMLASITVDVVSRKAIRKLLINGSKAQLTWDWNVNSISIYDPEQKKCEEIPYQMNDSAPGYNANIGENMYIEEIRAFLDAVVKKKDFVNTLENDHKVLKLLYTIEESDRQSKFLDF